MTTQSIQYDGQGQVLLNNLGASGTVDGDWVDLNKVAFASIGASVPSGTLKLQARDSDTPNIAVRTLQQWTTSAEFNVQRRGQIRFRIEGGQAKVVANAVSELS